MHSISKAVDICVGACAFEGTMFGVGLKVNQRREPTHFEGPNPYVENTSMAVRSPLFCEPQQGPWSQGIGVPDSGLFRFALTLPQDWNVLVTFLQLSMLED